MPTLLIDDQPFNYEMSGQSSLPTLIFSNSLGTSLPLWNGQLAALEPYFRLVRYDTRGHGGSVKSPGPYTIDQLGSDVLALATALGVETFHFCGISLGGLTGQWLALHAPERLKRVVLCNTAAQIGQPGFWKERAAQVRESGMGQVADGTAQRWFTSDFQKGHPDTAAWWVNHLHNTNPEGYAACCEALARTDFRSRLGEISTPTLVVAGIHDSVTTVEHADAMAREIPGAKRVNLPASHLSNLGSPALFNQTLLDFLRQ